MKFSVPFNGDETLIDELARFSDVTEIYGKLQKDFFGGGKCSFQIAFHPRKRFAQFVNKAHCAGLNFNYLLNSTCLNNQEWTISGQRKITSLIDWLLDINVDTVTISIPYIVELVKKRYPQLKVCISDLAYVNTKERARAWERLGADCITLSNVDVNRKFKLINDIRDAVKCELKLIANVGCLDSCAYNIYHGNIASHASQTHHVSKGFVIDYCRLKCRYQQLLTPVDFIKSSWIRPEDVATYESYRINMLKIIDRGMTTKTILNIVSAYVQRSYEGNLLDLFPNPKSSAVFDAANIYHKIKYFFHPFKVNVFKLKKFEQLLSDAVYIDNKKLDGFLTKLQEKNCQNLSCSECELCQTVAQEVVKIDEIHYEEMKKQFRECLEALISGDLFSYIKEK